MPAIFVWTVRRSTRLPDRPGGQDFGRLAAQVPALGGGKVPFSLAAVVLGVQQVGQTGQVQRKTQEKGAGCLAGQAGRPRFFHTTLQPHQHTGGRIAFSEGQHPEAQLGHQGFQPPAQGAPQLFAAYRGCAYSAHLAQCELTVPEADQQEHCAKAHTDASRGKGRVRTKTNSGRQGQQIDKTYQHKRPHIVPSFPAE